MKKYTKEEILKAAEIGEVSMIDARHIVSLLDEARHVLKVSFDFDGTLDKESVQNYAKQLIDQGIEVWITTSRFSDKWNDWASDWNDDLYEITNKLGIPKERIRFTEGKDKYHYFEDNSFLWHLDDDWVENRLINKFTKTKAISHIGSGNWVGKCNRIIKKLGGVIQILDSV